MGLNFALFSAHASKVELCLFYERGERELELELERIHRRRPVASKQRRSHALYLRSSSSADLGDDPGDPRRGRGAASRRNAQRGVRNRQIIIEPVLSWPKHRLTPNAFGRFAGDLVVLPQMTFAHEENYLARN